MLSGTLMLDLDGPCLTAEEGVLLRQPQVGGVILFGRNTETAAQLAQLVRAIRAIRPDLVIGIDQEGGRVQRLRDGVVRLPPMAALGALYQEEQAAALTAAGDIGYLMAAQLRALEVDISFAPVLDLDYGRNTVIGDRAFASESETVSVLAAAFVRGMAEAGMAATGKHFPGHGWADADTHIAGALDERSLAQIWQQDLQPFRDLVAAGLAAVMPAHVVYPACDAQPAGFSPFWLQEVLRRRLQFKGVIFSDDLSMRAAHGAGSYAARAAQALAAGCDVLLACNDRAGALEVLDYLQRNGAVPPSQLANMRGRHLSVDAARLARAATQAERLWQRVSG